MNNKHLNPDTKKEESIKNTIKKHYGTIAQRTTTCCTPKGCCNQSNPPDPGYTSQELETIPEAARAASAGCGNPVTHADLKRGEIVLDLGSGGGIDAILAAEKVGPHGKVIGVDMSPDMIQLAKRNVQESGQENTEFRHGEIEHLPVLDESVDVVISNCVINLCPDKDAVFKEAYRVLRKGGRIILSDMMAENLTPEASLNPQAWSECIGGAIPLEAYLEKMKEAGFIKVKTLAHSTYPPQFLADSLKAIGIMYDPGQAILSHAEILGFKPTGNKIPQYGDCC